MPRFDGTGPLGKGPMTGRGHGFCVLRESQDDAAKLEGFAGVEGVPVGGLPAGPEPPKEGVTDTSAVARVSPITKRAAAVPMGGNAIYIGPRVAPVSLTYFRNHWLGFGRWFGRGRRCGLGKGNWWCTQTSS